MTTDDAAMAERLEERRRARQAPHINCLTHPNGKRILVPEGDVSDAVLRALLDECDQRRTGAAA